MEQPSSKKWIWITLGVFVFLLFLWLFLYLGRDTTIGKAVGKILPFGAPTQKIPIGQGGSLNGKTTMETMSGGNTAESVGEEPLFRELASVPVAGAYALERNGIQYVRYIERETGHAYEVEVRTGATTQLTNTTIQRIAFANWASSGNAVVLSRLEADALLGRDVIKTDVGFLPVAAITQGDAGSSTPIAQTTLVQPNNQPTSMRIESLPDDISALSVASDGKNLFYLKKNTNGASGTIVNLETMGARRVFQSPFSEWAPQLLNDGSILLTTKPSGSILGYSYRYDPKTLLLERVVRAKGGLTTMGDPSGNRVLFGENVSRSPSLNVFSRKGYPGDEGIINYEHSLPLTTLPEKCAWLNDGIHVLCGAFVATQSWPVPDLWYQGKISFSDTFWLLNTDTSEVSFLADPKVEPKQEFDVVNPLVAVNQEYFIFINKNDGTLWSFHVPQLKTVTTPVETTPPAANLSPAELQDVRGSMPAAKGGTTSVLIRQ